MQVPCMLFYTHLPRCFMRATLPWPMHAEWQHDRPKDGLLGVSEQRVAETPAATRDAIPYWPARHHPAAAKQR